MTLKFTILNLNQFYKTLNLKTMCIIAVIPQGKQVSKETLKTCWENNVHGGGFCYTNGKSVETFKELASFKRFYNEFTKKRSEYVNSTFVVHFRISTHGKVNLDNCHPFSVNKQLAFAHNGIIHNSTRSENYSDTVMFNHEVLKKLPKNFVFDTTMHKLIQAYIGNGSKLAFLTHDNRYVIINEEAGVWDNGVWFSNRGYERSKYLDYGGTTIGWDKFYGNNYKGIASSQPKQSAMPKTTQKEIGFQQPRTWAKVDNDYADDFIYKPIVPVQGEKRFTGNLKGVSSVSRSVNTYDLGCAMCGKALKSKTELDNDLCFGCDDMYSGDFSV